METERDWHIVRRDDQFDLKDAGMGLLRFALLFGICAVVLALLAVPLLHKKSRDWMTAGSQVDPIRVGSTDAGKVYTVRKSVLQPSPNSVCIIRPNGTRSGDC